MQRKTESLAAELQGILADEPVDLARAALVIARLEYPDLNPRPSLDRLRAAFGPAVRARDRIFVAHETRADYGEVQGTIASQIVILLTGLSEDRLSTLGGIVFRDPVSEQDLPRTAA